MVERVVRQQLCGVACSVSSSELSLSDSDVRSKLPCERRVLFDDELASWPSFLCDSVSGVGADAPRFAGGELEAERRRPSPVEIGVRDGDL